MEITKAMRRSSRKTMEARNRHYVASHEGFALDKKQGIMLNRAARRHKAAEIRHKGQSR